MVAVRQKPPDQLKYRRGGAGRGLAVEVSERRRVLPMPRGLGEESQKVWRSFWKSKPSYAVDVDADAESIRHWIWCVDRRSKLRTRMDEEPGPHHIKLWVALNQEISKLEIAFGMTPLARFRLQLSYTEANKETLKLNRAQAAERARAQIPTPPVVVDYDA